MKHATFSHLLGIIACIGISSAGNAAEHVVKVVTDYENMRMYFDPMHITIDPDDTVTWVNQDDEDHNMVTFPDGYPKAGKGFESPYLTKKDEKWSHTFTIPGTYDYHCIPHLFMGMRGTVTVGWASAPEDYHVPTPEEVAAYRSKLLKFFDQEEFEHAPEYVRAKRKALKQECEEYCNKMKDNNPEK